MASPTPGGANTTPAFANGSVVAGKYLVEETIAEGGIGVVVVAKHLALQQRVAIKYLKAKALGTPAIVERFVREVRLAAQITSDHVVRVHDVGSLKDAGPYIVMEHLIGEDLGRTLQSGPLPVARAIDYVLQACDALAEAHSLGIVHRDIKPENLFIAQRASSTSILKIIDFGISKATPKNGENPNWARETSANDRFGTPLYMSPEQLRSTSKVDERTDIWSLGVVLHELLTGAPPFLGEDLPQVCTSIMTAEPPRVTSLRPTAPPELDAIVRRCLEKESARRYRNVAELAGALAPFGPPNATSRAERIAAVVRRGGGSIRPPAPAPGTLDVRPMSPPRITSTDVRAVTTVTLRRGVPKGKRAFFAVMGGVGCAALFVLLATRRGASAPAVSALRPPELAPSVVAASPLIAAAPPAAIALPSADAMQASAPPPATPHSAAGTSTPVPRSKPTLPSKARSATGPTAPGAAGLANRRAQFGERE